MKGQDLRIYLGKTSASTPIAHALDCTFHLGTSVEDDSDKDSTGDWANNVVTGKNWDVTANAKFTAGTESGRITTAEVIALFGTKVYVKLATAGTNGSVISGSAYITDIQIQSANKQTVTAAIQLTGDGQIS